MIRVRLSQADLLQSIEAEKPGWSTKAAAATTEALRKGGVDENDAIWSAIKNVYIVAQNHKCIYCERPMPKGSDDVETEGIGVEYDVEHFRPKNRVRPWPQKKHLKKRPHIDYQAEVHSGSSAGYVRLAFDPLNYCVSCKTCNSTHKADYFPIAGGPEIRLNDRAKMDAVERPFLLFPFGDDGDDPELFLGWEGIFPRPKAGAGPDHLRARVVIDFFELDTRRELLQGRAGSLVMLWPQLEMRTKGAPDERDKAKRFIVTMCTKAPYAGFARGYVELYGKDRDAAARWHEAALAYLTSLDPAVFSK